MKDQAPNLGAFDAAPKPIGASHCSLLNKTRDESQGLSEEVDSPVLRLSKRMPRESLRAVLRSTPPQKGGALFRRTARRLSLSHPWTNTGTQAVEANGSSWAHSA